MVSLKRLHSCILEHRGIFEAIAARDGEGAERLARAHIASARTIVLGAMTQTEMAVNEGGRSATVQG